MTEYTPQRPLVKNAADHGQVKQGGKIENRDVRRSKADLQAVLKMPEGRRFLQALIDHLAPVTAQKWEPPDIANYNMARIHLANWLKTAIEEAAPEALYMMQHQQYQEKLQASLPANNRQGQAVMEKEYEIVLEEENEEEA